MVHDRGPEVEHVVETERPRAARASLLRHLARACRAAAAVASGDRSVIESILAAAVSGTRTERAFVVRTEPSPDRRPCVEAYYGPPDRRGDPSRTALRLAAARTGASLVCTDVLGDARLIDGESVRAQKLRSVLAAPIPGGSCVRFLVLDGRHPAGPLLPASLSDALDAFAALASLSLPSAPIEASTDSETARSEAMREALAWADRVARTELPALIQGETGAGKELVARRIHARSRRPEGPLLAVNCAALPEPLLEAELFGSARGAYTGADRDRAGLFRQAHGGTLFLDEIGEMTPAMQAKLLRALEDRRIRPVGAAAEIDVDVRVLAATHRDLARLVDRGAFRADLFHRLAVLVIRVPPLRERLQDLHPLVNEMTRGLARETGCRPPRIEDDAWRALESHDWPGNVRELRAVLARAMLRAGTSPIRTAHLGDLRHAPAASEAQADDSLERRMIVDAVREAGGVVAQAAVRIGWTRQKLVRRMRALGVARGEA